MRSCGFPAVEILINHLHRIVGNDSLVGGQDCRHETSSLPITFNRSNGGSLPLQGRSKADIGLLLLGNIG